MSENIDLIGESFEKSGIELNEYQIRQFYNYYLLLTEKNKVMNLTTITDYKDVIYKHFIDSCLISKIKEFYNVVNEKRQLSMIDVGTGAGFPGIPLKILYPDLKVTLLDSLNKRINFLKETVNVLELDNVECIHGRAEEYGNKIEYREKFDICVSRAVANLSTLSEYTIPFIRVKGVFISYKAGNIEEEVNNSKNALKMLNSKIIKVENVYLNDNNGNVYERNFVIIEKDKKLSSKYPRKSGMPSKNPL